MVLWDSLLFFLINFYYNAITTIIYIVYLCSGLFLFACHLKYEYSLIDVNDHALLSG